jgi:hypothetical protein
MAEVGAATAPEKRTHAIVVEAQASTAPWVKILSLDALRYQKTGWWIDWAMPHDPRLFLAFALLFPTALFAAGVGLAPDRDAYLAAHDVSGQPLFLAVHFICLRMIGTLFARGARPSLGGLGVDDKTFAGYRLGVAGVLPNVGAIAAAAYWIQRDVRVALTVDEETGLTAFDDPDQWDMAALGHPLQYVLLGVWILEWLIFGYILWLQIWSIIGFGSSLRRTAIGPHLHRILVHDEYRDFFALIARNASICAAFAVANLGFIAFTGELMPKPTRVVETATDFLEEMSDLTSVAVLFVVIVAGYISFVFLIRRALTQAINDHFAAAGDNMLEASEGPLELGGATSEDMEKLKIRLYASVALLRAMAFQREVDALGSRGLNTLMLKALPALGTVGIRVYKLITHQPPAE